MASKSSSARSLLSRGDVLEVTNGKLLVVSASGKPVPDSWVKSHTEEIVMEIVEVTGTDVFTYESHSTGRYGRKHYSGVSLQFNHVLSGKNFYAIFNADLDRARTTRKGKKGDPLPTGQFRIGKKSRFFQFWKNAGMKIPSRLASIHDYMGNLKNILFTARYCDGKKLEKQTIHPLNLSHKQILKAFSISSTPDNLQTTPIQQTDKSHTDLPYSGSTQTHMQQGVQADRTTRQNNYGIRLQGSAVTRGAVVPIGNASKPEDQSNNEWLADYCNED